MASKVFPQEELIPGAIKTAEKIASMSHSIAAFAKECVNKCYELTLNEGMYVCVYLCTYVCMYVYIYVCMCARAYLQSKPLPTELLRVF